MRRAIWVASAALAAAVVATFAVAAGPPAAAAPGKFTLVSPEIKAGGKIADAQVFNGFGCQGANVSPALSWSHAPKDTQSFALMVHDPDAPTGSGWWHWIDLQHPRDHNLTARRCGQHARTCCCQRGRSRDAPTSGLTGYGGPCPPPGPPHHYYFRLYALKVAEAGPAQGCHGGLHRLQRAGPVPRHPPSLLGIYGR